MELRDSCPNCKEGLDSIKYEVFSFQEVEGATLDCYHCDSLLIVYHGDLKDFHSHINEKDSRWPKDGKGTGFIEV